MDSEHPDSADPDVARGRLDDERARLKRLLDEVEHEQEEGRIGTISGDGGTETATATELIAVRSDLESQIEEVDAALGRIDDGTYGIDEVSGEPIDPARLEAVPTARTNI